MKEYLIISFTKQGYELGEQISKNISSYHLSVTTFSKYHELDNNKIDKDIVSFTGEVFNKVSVIIFISAVGIAVRSIAPYIKSKVSDPAVIVIDDTGKYVIPILSGHLGGANRISKEVAAIIKGEAVITTATDSNNCFSPDGWAEENNCYIVDKHLIKKISSEILKGQTIAFKSDFPIKGNIPKELDMGKTDGLTIWVTNSIAESNDHNIMRIIPKNIVLGIGCRQGVTCSLIEESVIKAGININLVSQVASIDLKSREVGLIEFCNKYGLKFVTYSAQELEKIEGDFTPSEFVKSVTGVDNVCERSAVKAAKGSNIIVNKTVNNGVTVAAALTDWVCRFKEVD